MTSTVYLCVAVAMLVLSQAAPAASDFPSAGLLYNTRETHSLKFDCDQRQGGLLECNFVQTAVRIKAKPEELEGQLKDARDYFRKNGADIRSDDCGMYKQLLSFLEGRATPPKPEGLKKLTTAQRSRTIELMQALLRVCEKPTEENYLQARRVAFQKDLNTCRISSNTWKQTFRQANDWSKGPRAWIAQSKPEGVCGAVDLSRFEPDKSNDFTFWRFVSRKAITNPSASFMGVQCKDLDESEYVWDWRDQQNFISCEFVEFSVL